MFADPLEHIDEMDIEIDAVRAAGDDQALDDADVFGTELGPAEVGSRPSKHSDMINAAIRYSFGMLDPFIFWSWMPSTS
jgi:hypothetical protein